MKQTQLLAYVGTTDKCWTQDSHSDGMNLELRCVVGNQTVIHYPSTIHLLSIKTQFLCICFLNILKDMMILFCSKNNSNT